MGIKTSSIGAALAGLAVGICTAYASAQLMEMSQQLFEQIELQYDHQARQRVEAWHQLLLEGHARSDWSDLDKARRANDFFNQLEWVSDLQHWGQEDYWATPIEMLATNGGDCEDFSIGKFFTLSETGVDGDKIRITYVKALSLNQAHMVLAYYPYPEAEPLILDNINKNILPASQRTDLLPIYSFNAEGLWLARSRGKKLKADSQQSLPQWREVNERLLQELAL